MNNERGRPQDLNQLSAYLDDALNDKERKALETRLLVDLELRQKLENLRTTKYLINNLPAVRAPRNFTLSAEMVKVRRKKRQPLFGAFRLATSLAAILLVVLFGVEMLLGERLAALPRSMSEPQMEAATTFDAETPEPLILWGEPGLAEGGGVNGYGGGEEFMAEAPQVESELAPEEPEVIEEALPEALPEGVTEEESMLEATREDEAQSQKRQALEDAPPILGLNPEQGGEMIAQTEVGTDAGEAAPLWQVALRWGQVALAVIALGGGVALWLLRRKI